jgi:hypothetical protein
MRERTHPRNEGHRFVQRNTPFEKEICALVSTLIIAAYFENGCSIAERSWL